MASSNTAAVALPASSSVARFVADHNPFYILSAICMILGIFALNDSFDWSPMPPDELLWLVIILNVYEISLIGLGALLARRGIFRDVIFLLVIEAFFLADVGFLNMEMFTADVVLGLLVNSALLVAAVAKIAVIFRLANLPILSGLYGFVMLQMFMLLAVPGLLANSAMGHGGDVPPLAIYVAWWLIGALPALAVVLAPAVSKAGEFALLNRIGRCVAPIFVALPFVSLAAHLALNHWVYKAEFSLAHAAPVLLGLAMFAARSNTMASLAETRRRLQVSLPLGAVVLAALGAPDALSFDVVGMTISPLRLTLVGASFVCLDGLLHFRRWVFACLACGYLTAAGMGPTVPAMIAMATHRADATLSAVESVQPKTSTHWGVLAIVFSFVLLALGAAISILRSAARPLARSDEPRVAEAIVPIAFEPSNGAAFPVNPRRSE